MTYIKHVCNKFTCQLDMLADPHQYIFTINIQQKKKKNRVLQKRDFKKMIILL